MAAICWIESYIPDPEARAVLADLTAAVPQAGAARETLMIGLERLARLLSR